MREQVSPEGVDEEAEPARLDLTVRDAILAAAELISDVPIPRSPAAGRPDEDGRRPGEAVRRHG
ncbi:hypothetical protein QRX60_14530 [Amycolatopsis mongoliensis]|uniref:Uncharacterized protein n=1 Tax=Amycolatopsis mongoliensis TaxID=715475 RepID=A0A9Y2JUM4_9PSEU|nr:hypothetical protein [Amycolatopsis sp. 4-36]WIY04993.1 hypothetical protein QRX60_14530 [Amycolatopsis sp. 4-36]